MVQFPEYRFHINTNYCLAIFRWGSFDYKFYDSLSRLNQADYNFGDTVYNYGYDVAGNMVNYDGVTRTYNAANQMTNDGTNTLTYDNNGNLRTVGSDTYTWDRANRLLSVGNHSYVYDGLGARVQQSVSTVVTDYLNDVQPSLTKLLKQTTGATVEKFVHGVRGIHAVDDGTDWNFYMQDGLGSVRAMVDDAGVVQNSMSYDPYGNVLGGSSPTDFGFTGEQTDANGSLFLRARYYDPSLGVFNALDPMEMPNRYSYVAGNPIMLTDPTGLNPAAAVTPACVAFVLGDGPLPIGDAVCVTMLALVGLSGLWAWLNTQQALSNSGTLTGTSEAERARTQANIDAAIAAALSNPNPYQNSDENQNPETRPDPLIDPVRPITRVGRRGDEECATNALPGTSVDFENLEDLRCNLRNYTLQGSNPDPNLWINSWAGSGIGQRLTYAGLGAVNSETYGADAVFSPLGVSVNNRGAGSIEIWVRQPSVSGRTRADIMSAYVHELRHAGQYLGVFEGQYAGDDPSGPMIPPCSSLTGELIETDAFITQSRWMYNSHIDRSSFTPEYRTIYPGRFAEGVSNYRTMRALLRRAGYDAYYGDRWNNPPVFSQCPDLSSSRIRFDFADLCLDIPL